MEEQEQDFEQGQEQDFEQDSERGQGEDSELDVTRTPSGWIPGMNLCEGPPVVALSDDGGTITRPDSTVRGLAKVHG